MVLRPNVMEGLRGSEISTLLQHYDSFKGCFSATNVPHLSIGQCVIINTSAAPPGEHWWSLCRFGPEEFEAFDSAGVNLRRVRDSLQLDSEIILHYNSERLMPFGSNKCGLYCVMYVAMRLDNLDCDLYNLMPLMGFNKTLLATNESVVTNFVAENLP